MKNLFKMTNLFLQKMGSGKKSVLIIAVLLILISPLIATAGHGSIVTINSWDNQPFVIEIDHQRYQANGSFTLRDVKPGKVRVRIFRNTTNSYHHMNSGNSGRGVILYNGFIDVPRNSKVRARVDRNRRLKILKVHRLNSRPNTNRPNRPAAGQCGTGGYGQIQVQPVEEAHGFEPYSYEHTSGYGGACAMEYSEFEELLREIENACFSDDKLRVARQALRHNLITAIQLEDLIRSMDFSSTELEVAKMGFENVIDKENIWKVYDAFSFSNTARQFEEFVCQQ